MIMRHDILLYLINIHWLSVDFDWSRAGLAEDAILSCRMTILPSDICRKTCSCTCNHMRLFYGARGVCYYVLSYLIS